MPTTVPDPVAPRTGLQWLDLIAGILLTAIAALTGLVMLSVVNQLGGLGAECEGIAESGTHCSPGFLSGMVILGTAVVVFAWFFGLGFLIVRAVRRRIVFFLPFLAFAVMVAGFYLVTALISANYLPAS
jgi:hypothetical protein